jgi:hypothetical protein
MAFLQYAYYTICAKFLKAMPDGMKKAGMIPAAWSVYSGSPSRGAPGNEILDFVPGEGCLFHLPTLPSACGGHLPLQGRLTPA